MSERFNVFLCTSETVANNGGLTNFKLSEPHFMREGMRYMPCLQELIPERNIIKVELEKNIGQLELLICYANIVEESEENETYLENQNDNPQIQNEKHISNIKNMHTYIFEINANISMQYVHQQIVKNPAMALGQAYIR